MAVYLKYKTNSDDDHNDNDDTAKNACKKYGENVRPRVYPNGTMMFCGLGPYSVMCPPRTSCEGHELDVYAVCCPNITGT